MKKLSFIKLISSMVIFGTIGAFVRLIDAERGFIAASRGIIGALFLIALALVLKKKISFSDIKKNILLLIISGAAIGINWILLFESYSYTTIAASTLCYYMAPVIVIILSPFIFKTGVSPQKLICAAVAIVGALLVSGVLEGGEGVGIVGCLLALGAAVFYASVIIMNKLIKDIDPYDMTVVQLVVAGLTVLPYTFIAEQNDFSAFDPIAVIMLVTVAILHTGIAYALYFSSIRDLRTDTVAIFSYLDPVVAIVVSLALGEDMTLLMGIGALLIMTALILSEIKISPKISNNEGTN